MSGPRIVVTGREGQIVRALLEVGTATGLDVRPVGRPELDLAAPASVLPALRALAPDVVVNAAAYTAVDRAEEEPALALAINGTGAGAVAAAAAALGCPVLQLSTDYVFDGSGTTAWREGDPLAPLGAYGRSKAAGEAAVAAATPRHVILRTAWVFSPFGSNFVRTMLRLAATREEVGVVDDQWGCPTSALDAAAAILAVAGNVASAAAGDSRFGIFHLTNAGEASWADVAEAVFARSAALGGPAARVRRIPTAAFPTPARRPLNGRLDGRALERVHGLRLPPWRPSLDSCVGRLLAG